jgi:hypothetical integral membrane protein (TIGR02206 family)
VNHPFSFDYDGGSFELFSLPHAIAILVIAAVIFLLYGIRESLRTEPNNRKFRSFLICLLVFSEAALTIWFLLVGEWSVTYSLPLQLCDLSLFLAAIMLVNKSYLLFEFVYFAGLSGAVQAILTPDLGIYSFPHFRAFQFFIAHGAVVIASLFMVIVEGYRPRWKSIWNAFGLLNVYALIIGIINRMMQANYLFLSHKPENPSLMDFLGPWPWYILSLEMVAVLMFLLLFLPFAFPGLINRKSTSTKNVRSNMIAK